MRMNASRWPLFLAGAMGLSLLSCEDDMDDSWYDEGQEPKETTFLLYMVGQNDLKNSLLANIEDLKTGLSLSDVDANVLVYADISSTPTLYQIAKDRSGNVRQTTVKTYPDQYSVAPSVMKDVINDVLAQYPAWHYGVTFSSHADGSLYRQQTVGKRSFGYEGSQGLGMNITDIRQALDGCPRLDLILFDACMMASVETAYELKGNARYFLAAPNSVPAEGFPYDKVLPYILRMDASGLSRAAEGYMTYFRNNGVEWDNFVSVSLTDLSRMDSLALYMDSLFQDETVHQRVRELDRDRLQHFENGYPLYDYGEWVDSVGGACRYVAEVRRVLDDAVVYKAHNDYSSVNDYTAMPEIPVKDGAFCGLNTYVPDEIPGLFYTEAAQMEYFTSQKWYRDAGFWRVPLYNVFEPEETE